MAHPLHELPRFTSVSLGLHEMPPSVRQEAIAELARVTKPGGTIVIVDYAVPAGRIAYHLVKLYERDSYVELAHSDVRGMLERAVLAIRGETRGAGGALMILLATR